MNLLALWLTDLAILTNLLLIPNNKLEAIFPIFSNKPHLSYTPRRSSLNTIPNNNLHLGHSLFNHILPPLSNNSNGNINQILP
jgi:hypothetical protein